MQQQRLLIVIGGLVVVALLLAGGGYWWLHRGHKQQMAAAAARPHLIGMLGATATELDATAPDQDKLCAASLTRALDFGALPPGANLVSNDAQAAQTEGHFTCQAQAGDGKYTIAVDTTCPGSDAKTCFALDSIRREDGTITYQREM
jgi:hypothetical protein